MAWCLRAPRCCDGDDVSDGSAAPRSSACAVPFVYLLGRRGVTSLCSDGGAICGRRARVQVLTIVTLLIVAILSSEVPAQQAAPALTRQITVTRVVRRGNFLRTRISYDVKTDATYQGCRILIRCGDVELNPGPARHVPDRAFHTPPLQDGELRPNLALQPNLRIAHQNSRSLRNKLGVLRAHSPELKRNDVFAISETWLSADVTDAELHVGLNSHSWFRRDRPTHGGGVACAVRSSLSPIRRYDPEPE